MEKGRAKEVIKRGSDKESDKDMRGIRHEGERVRGKG